MKPDPHDILQRHLNAEEVSEAEIAVLSDWLGESSANARYFVESAAIDQRLEEIVQEDTLRQMLVEDDDKLIVQSVIDEATFRRQITEVREARELEQRARDEEAAARRAAEQDAPIDRGPRVIVIPKAVAWLGIAAMLGIIGTLGHMAFRPAPEPAGLADRAEDGAAEDATRAPVVAMPVASVLRESDADAASGLSVGTELVPGRYELTRGFVEVGMGRGASVLVQGPCRFELIDDNQLYLIDGQLTADVPERAHLFTVQTPSMTLIDLGTRFGARVNPDGSATAAVFDGEVIAKQIASPAAASEPAGDANNARVISHKLTTSTAIHATHRDGIDAQPHALAPDHDFLPTWRDVAGRARVTGQARFFVQPPADIRPNALTDPDHMIVFQEQITETDAPIRVMTELSATAKRPAHNAQVPAGTRVISYMIHFSPAQFTPGTHGQPGGDSAYTVNATIEFPGRVLGLISGGGGLANTNASLGLDSVAYPDPSNTGYNNVIDNWPTDRFAITGAQQNVLTIQLAAGVHSDQARVLIEVPAN